MANLTAFIKGIVLAEQAGQDIDGLVSTLANMPNVDSIGANGAPQPYGEAAIRELISKGREAALAALEKDKKKRARAAAEAAQNALRTEAEGFTFDFPPHFVSALGDLFGRAKALDAALVLNVDGENVTLSVSGLKSPTVGTGGGKPAANQPRPFVTLAGERVVGSLTKWARENVNEDYLVHAPHKDGKLRGGKVLVTFLTSKHEVEGEEFGPFLSRSEGEDFQAAVSAWEATHDDS